MRAAAAQLLVLACGTAIALPVPHQKHSAEAVEAAIADNSTLWHHGVVVSCPR